VKTGEGRSGSVYGYVTVPDFAKEDLSMAGALISADSALPSKHVAIRTVRFTVQ
jgi:hypothetical protein